MAGATTTSLVSAIVVLCLVALLSFPGALQVYRRFVANRQQYQEISDKYEDDDGVATEESQAAFSTKLHRVLLVLIALVGFALTLVSAILAILRSDARLSTEYWLHFATWILLAAQVCALFTASIYNEQAKLGIHGMLSSLVLILGIIVENVSLAQSKKVPEPRNLHVTLTATQVGAAFILGIVYFTIPRRPDVFHDGVLVDRQYTGSFFGQYTWSWPSGILRSIGNAQTLEIGDLPKVNSATRSKALRRQFESWDPNLPLWKKLVKSHWVYIIAQWGSAAATSITGFGPTLTLFAILKTLEARDAGGDVRVKLWGLAVAMGASIVLDAWVQGYCAWVSWANLAIPILEQLAAVIFGKSTRRKDVKGSTKKKEIKEADESETLINKGAGPEGEDTAITKGGDDDETEDEDGGQKSKQSTINLIAVDAKRIADFVGFCDTFMHSAIKLIVAIFFLVQLIGWIPLLCGFVIPVIITPVNILAARRYSAAQDKLMKTRDSKMAVITEALQGIRQIKFSALETQWQKKIMTVRINELNTQWTVFFFDTVLISIWILGPVLLGAVSLTVYALINKELSASVAFTTISVFDSIEMVLAVVPELVTDFLDAKVSADRLEKYLHSPEKVTQTKEGDAISYKDVTVAWPSDDADDEDHRFQLHNMNITFPSKELSVVSGKTGAGKSLLLASILGECDVVSGTLTVPKPPPSEERYDEVANRSNWIISASIAYVSQIPWIENTTIKDNILFGLPEEPARYKKTVTACALDKDLEMLPDGDMTDIGVNGINLSGGQKWRVSFARALYSRAGTLVLDDIFSAVDAHVGRHLYEQALTGELGKGRTRILVTHHVGLCLPRTKYSVLLGEGTVQHAGTIDELRETGHLQAILDHDINEKEKEEEEDEENAVMIDDGGGLQRVMTNASKKSRRESRVLTKRKSSVAVNGKDGDAGGKKIDQAKQFNEEEKREKGAIKFAIMRDYIKASGGVPYWLWILSVYVLGMLLMLGKSGWITAWTRSYETESAPGLSTFTVQKISHYAKEQFQATEVSADLKFYLGVYVAISVVYCVISTSRYFFVFWASITASRALFEDLTYAIIRAPLRWLDTVPVGRILNRFTADFNLLDSRIAMNFGMLANNVMSLLSVLIAAFFVSPWMILFAGILLAVCVYYATVYLKAARETKRLESTLKSPVYENFGSTLVGIGTIRAFDKVPTYVDRMYKTIDRHCQAYWHIWLFSRWMGFRLAMSGAVFSTVTAILIVSLDGIDAPLAGFALAFTLDYTSALSRALREYANFQLEMNAAERIVEYSNITIEKQDGDPVPAAWPSEGRLEVSDLVVGYAPELPPVLKGLSFSVSRNQRVGVVGRTGAGKSSLTLALFRFLEAREGSIYIDGIDISKIKLLDLRSRLAIIPQDPVLFSGSVRGNLDAFDEHTDDELRDALQRVHLISGTGTTTPNNATASSSSSTEIEGDRNTNLFTDLRSKISEGGLNLSQGQRQLLCLARAIVSRPKIMVLDEATSAVDMATDALIQRSIREEFTDSTLVVIAHRLSTIADFDRILVMGDGRVVEYDTPENLMGKEGGVFKSMVEESGERDVLEGIIKGRNGAAGGGKEEGSGSESTS